ncbi:MAG TPA: type IV secretory system conjugative DNA transfer family protein [Longimicrobiaceae bacterium]|nr:type IV secretory system conjugative DNA transfer family protein [Longimicrobiaceae bacterium]
MRCCTARRGLLLGRQGERLLRLAGEGHVLTVAPTPSGKGVSSVIPNLLDHPGSVLVTDPKGENYAVTARWRRDVGHPVYPFDPFQIARGDATYNPLDLINVASPEAVDDARLFADMLVLAGVREDEQAFWNEEARGVLTGLILQVRRRPAGDVRGVDGRLAEGAAESELGGLRRLLALVLGLEEEAALLEEVDAAGGFRPVPVHDADGVFELVAGAGGPGLLDAQRLAQLRDVELGVGHLAGGGIAPAFGEGGEGGEGGVAGHDPDFSGGHRGRDGRRPGRLRVGGFRT